MISFRYHLVSIVAVVLAFAIGVLAGTSVIGDPIARELRRNYQTVRSQRDDARGQRDVYAAAVEIAVPHLLTGALEGVEAVIVTQEGSDGGLVDRAGAALEQAGATVMGRLSVELRLAAPRSAEDREALGVLLGRPGSSGSALPRVAASDLAERLAQGPGRDAPGATDVLVELVDQGFLGNLDGADLEDVGGIGQVIVVVSGGDGEPGIGPQAFLVPLIEELVNGTAPGTAGAVPVAAAEAAASTYGFVQAVREDDALPDQEMVTIDDLDSTLGSVALVLGLERLMASPLDGGGDYGLDGSSLLPEFEARPSPTPTG